MDRLEAQSEPATPTAESSVATANPPEHAIPAYNFPGHERPLARPRIPRQLKPTPDQATMLNRIESLRAMIVTYNGITEKLHRSHEQLQQQLVRVREELSDKNRQLERRNRLTALGEMAAGMAHEIRNPLGGIQLYASLLAKDVEDRPASLSLVRKISQGVKHLESLVGQVLQFTREITPQPTDIDLAEVVRHAVDLAAPQCDQAGVQCIVDGPPALAASADATLLGQAILNLLRNAVEAMSGQTPPRRLILAFGPPEDSRPARQFWLNVADTGPGVAPAIVDRIFNPFFTTKETGTGLGLAIVHRIVEAHEGTIVVTSAPQGGAVFSVRV